MKSTHKMTRQQFSAGTTIDGNRLDKAAGDVVARYNAIEPSDIKRRFTQSQFVLGWEPYVSGTCSLPFMPSYNKNSAYWMAGTAPVDSVQNVWRSKGFISERFNFIVDPVVDSPTKDMLLATATMYIRNPCILQGMSLAQMIDNGYRPEYHSFDYQSKVDGTWIPYPADDLSLTVMVDNPYAPEDMKQGAVVYHRLKFGADAQKYSAITPAPGYPEMSPSMPDFPEAVWIDDQRLNIPIPRDSRVRFVIGIPYGNPSNNVLGGFDDFRNPWRAADGNLTRPWNAQYWTSTVTLLEPLEE